jgi:hypothetical protein
MTHGVDIINRERLYRRTDRLHCWQKRCSAPSTTTRDALECASHTLCRRWYSFAPDSATWHPSTWHRGTTTAAAAAAFSSLSAAAAVPRSPPAPPLPWTAWPPPLGCGGVWQSPAQQQGRFPRLSQVCSCWWSRLGPPPGRNTKGCCCG